MKILATGILAVVFGVAIGIATDLLRGQLPGVFATFGITDDAFLDIVFGKHAPKAPDAAHDLDDPLFKFGFGLTYSEAGGDEGKSLSDGAAGVLAGKTMKSRNRDLF